MPLDKASQRFLSQLDTIDLSVADIAELRKASREAISAWDIPQVDVRLEKSQSIDGPNGPIPVRIYWPAESEKMRDLPVVVAFHGGGWVLGDLDLYDNFCRYTCKYGIAIVVSVDYRLAPEHKFPGAVEDAFAAFCWAIENAHEMGGAPGKICVAGESAGGNLAAVVCHLAKQHLDRKVWKQLLFCPSVALTAHDSEYESKRLYGETDEYGLSNVLMRQFLSMYVKGKDGYQDLRLSPILAEDFSDLPPALVIVAEYDLLRDEGAHYARRLQEANVPTVLSCYPGVLHGFMSQSGWVGVGIEALNEAVAFIREPFPSEQ